MARTRSQESRGGRPHPDANHQPPIPRGTRVVNQANEEGIENVPPVTLEAVQGLIHSYEERNRAETKKCTYKDFMICRPKEFNGDKDPKVVIRWIVEMEEILHICRSEESMKVGFASQMLKDDALVWWRSLNEAIGREGISSLTWSEFVRRLKAKFCSPRHQEKLVNEFFALRKGDLTIDEYNKKFSDLLPFLGNSLPDEIGRVSRYVSGLPGKYTLEVGKATTLDEAMETAAKVEDSLTKMASEKQAVGEKRKIDVSPNPNKKNRYPSSHSKKDETRGCKKCGKRHVGECKVGTADCFKCGQFGHKARDCRSGNVECFSCHEKGHYSSHCPRKGKEVLKND